MLFVDPSSPWWPLYVAQLLGHGRPAGLYGLRLEHWVSWHYAFLLTGAGFVPAARQTTLELPEAA